MVADTPVPLNPNETTAVELADGRVMLNIRNESGCQLRGISISPNGATGWSEFQFDKQLPDPVCFGSLVRLSKKPEQDKNRILFSNLDNAQTRERKNLTIRLSEDEGQTWPIAKVLVPGPCGYSDLAVGNDGTIYCFYEEGMTLKTAYNPRGLLLSKFKKEWLTDANQTKP